MRGSGSGAAVLRARDPTPYSTLCRRGAGAAVSSSTAALASRALHRSASPRPTLYVVWKLLTLLPTYYSLLTTHQVTIAYVMWKLFTTHYSLLTLTRSPSPTSCGSSAWARQTRCGWSRARAPACGRTRASSRSSRHGRRGSRPVWSCYEQKKVGVVCLDSH